MDPTQPVTTLARLLRGPFNFLVPEETEIQRLMPDAGAVLPRPQQIFLEDETATPITGFPILKSPGLETLHQALHSVLKWEEHAEIARIRRQSFDKKTYQLAWESYRQHLARASENATASSYGRHFPDIFWLAHSFEVARILKESPRRVMRYDSAFGREHADRVKYRVFFTYLDRVINLTYDLVHRISTETEEAEEELFPTLLARMRDNVLIFTEDHIGRDLTELSSYFAGYLNVDGRDLRFRLARLARWLDEELERNPPLAHAARHLFRARKPTSSRALLANSGWTTYLSTLPTYDQSSLLAPRQVEVWEKLLLKLKEFELLHGLRRLAVPLSADGHGRLVFQERSLNRTWIGPSVNRVSETTRPYDFMAPWVLDPLVERFGLIYDLTDFSHIVSMLRRAGNTLQDQSFRQMFLFQRRINRLAASHRLKMEKYLGDGAFFSGREARRLVPVAIQLQRIYRRVLDEGFPFDRGLRIALNHGQYRLLPIQTGVLGEADRYEFFGHGIVELTRLTTGKTTKEIEEVKNLLISQGYAEPEVLRFFAPLSARRMDLVNRAEEERSFYSYIDSNGNLVNEGIVATHSFVERLAEDDGPGPLQRAVTAQGAYVVRSFETPEGEIPVGLRKLGFAKLKGLETLPVYEVLDLGRGSAELERHPDRKLETALEREYTSAMTRG